MRSLARLTRLFDAITSVAVASSAIAACAATQVSREGFTTNACSGNAYEPVSQLPLAGLRPKVPVDYLEVRGGMGRRSVGTMCATATDAAKCKTAVEQVTSTAGFGASYLGAAYLVYTRGDEVGAIAKEAELRAFLSFSTLADAAALAWANGHSVMCSENNAGETAAGFVLLTQTGNGCPGPVDQHRVSVSRNGDFAVVATVRVHEGSPGCQVGRRPEGLEPCAYGHTKDDLGGWFAQLARLEAASVIAFEHLAEELHELGAPEELVAIARDSALDELRHAAMTAALARRFGSAAQQPAVAPRRARRLLEIARENAVEGCVRETFGALVATHQRDRATDASIREAMRIIARDETRHAALAWEIAAWAEPRLTSEERSEIAAAQREAALALRLELEAEPPTEAQRLAGAPRARDALAMFDAAAAELWCRGVETRLHGIDGAFEEDLARAAAHSGLQSEYAERPEGSSADGSERGVNANCTPSRV
jgi:hypothetical protein